jgi:hypothetical protein
MLTPRCSAPGERSNSALNPDLPAGYPQLAVATLKADVLVLGSVHRGPLQRVVPGSVATRLLHGTPCPVAVAPRGYAAGEPKLGTVGLAFDGMEEAGVAAREAARIAPAADAALPRSRAARPG